MLSICILNEFNPAKLQQKGNVKLCDVFMYVVFLAKPITSYIVDDGNIENVEVVVVNVNLFVMLDDVMTKSEGNTEAK
jgi:hypothetical protein